MTQKFSRSDGIALRVAMCLIMLSAVTAQARIISSNSFETPVVSGRSTTNPDGWIGATGYGTGQDGIENEDSGTFSTPYGAQGAIVWANRSCLTSAETNFNDALTTNILYTVSFNVAKPSDLTGAYNVQLLAIDPGDPRNYYNRGTVLTSTSGTATLGDMSESVSFQYSTADPANQHIGRQLAVRIMNSTRSVLDNLVVQDDTDGSDVYPPALSYRYPLNNAATMTTNYPLIMVFNEDVTNGTGNITVRLGSDDSAVETIDVTSGQVSIDSNVVTITRSTPLQLNTAYYVNIDATAFDDLATNSYPGISTTSGWAFSTVTSNGPNVIYTTSFESPVVSGKVTTNPDGWIGATGYGTGKDGLVNEDAGTFVTPYGAQAAIAWGNNRNCLTTAEATFSDTLVSNITYTVTFNVANTLNKTIPTALNDNYIVQLVAMDAGDTRDYHDHGTVLASVSGSAVLSDVEAQAAGFTFTADSSNPNLGRQLAVRILDSTGDGCPIDNLTFSDSNTAGDIAPPALWYRYPRDNQTTMTVDYPLLMTFSEDVVKGAGDILIRLASDDSIIETIDVTSGQVAITNTEVTVARAVDLERGESYYVTVDSGAFVDAAANPFAGVSGTTAWNFSTPIADQETVIYTTSFESPVVSGRVNGTAPAGWVLSTGYGTGSQGIENEDSGTFSTPYGSQVGMLWGSNRSNMNTDSNTIEEVLVADYPYTVSFNIVKNTDLSGYYKIQLVAYDPGEARNGSSDTSYGSVLAEKSGTAILSDAAAAADAFTFTAGVAHADLGKLLGIRIRGMGTIDNLKLTWIAPPPAGTVFMFL